MSTGSIRSDLLCNACWEWIEDKNAKQAARREANIEMVMGTCIRSFFGWSKGYPTRQQAEDVADLKTTMAGKFDGLVVAEQIIRGIERTQRQRVERVLLLADLELQGKAESLAISASDLALLSPFLGATWQVTT